MTNRIRFALERTLVRLIVFSPAEKEHRPRPAPPRPAPTLRFRAAAIAAGAVEDALILDSPSPLVRPYLLAYERQERLAMAEVWG